MSDTQLTHEESLDLYGQQTEFVRTAVNHNPKLVDVFNDDEQKTFQKYFLPDWVEEGNFVHYYEKWEREDPEFIMRANELLKKFMEQNNLDETGLLNF